ncbi:MAG TPA: hypothetical protein VEC38_08305 [Candidatus Binataceae bacterium]|nr:hypothetical protein [Candidatus Binataceae bacterium]
MRPVPSHLASAAMLTHFTRASETARAIDNLISILRTGVIRGGRRMVRGGKPAVCMFDVPLAELRTLLVRRNRRRYQPFGIAVDRRYAFRMGARPVIYMPWREARDVLPSAEFWRVVNMEYDRTPPIDWSFEREWRVRGDLPIPERLCAALVETWRDADEIYDRFAGRPPCAGVIPLSELFGAP